MSVPLQPPQGQVLAEPHFLTDWEAQRDPKRSVRAGVLSILLHVLVGVGLTLISAATVTTNHEILQLTRSTPLVEPPPELTQRAPNRGAISKEFNVESLLARPRLEMPPVPTMPAPVPFRAPSAPAQRLAPAPAPVVPEPPKIEAAQVKPPFPVAPGTPQAPPPAHEQPKLAFESVGSQSGFGNVHQAPGTPKVQIPHSTIAEMAHSAQPNAAPGGAVVGDTGDGSIGQGGIRLPPSPGHTGSRLELLSDPMGIDFRSYLAQVLLSVRRNWLAIFPESARLGQRGKVVVLFAIQRDGRVAKVVFGAESGVAALDRAAVAGISASDPFPPLPTGYKSNRITLQLTFLYNIR